MQAHAAAFQRGLQVGVRGRPALTLAHGHFHRAKAFLLFAVVIVGQFEPGLAPGFDKSLVQRDFPAAAGHRQRPALSAPVRIAALAIWIPVFHPVEIRRDIGPAPAIGALFGPMVIIQRMTTHIDHPVDRR